jgi:hypothetical protein
MALNEDAVDYQPLRTVAKVIYFVHLVLAALFATYLLISHPQVVSLSITFITVLIYGYMIVWVIVMNFILIVLIFLR